MKKLLFTILLLFISISSFCQILIAKTEDGRRVLLKADNTWEFIDKVAKKETTKDISFPKCELPIDFKEPKGNEKIQGWLKKVDARVKDLKEHVAVDNNCSVEDIKITKISEQKGNGNYVLCVNGKEMRYRRTGSVFHRQGVSPVGNY